MGEGIAQFCEHFHPSGLLFEIQFRQVFPRGSDVALVSVRDAKGHRKRKNHTSIAGAFDPSDARADFDVLPAPGNGEVQFSLAQSFQGYKLSQLRGLLQLELDAGKFRRWRQCKEFGLDAGKIRRGFAPQTRQAALGIRQAHREIAHRQLGLHQVRTSTAQFRPTGAASIKPPLGNVFCGACIVDDLPGKGQQALDLRYFQITTGRCRQCVQSGKFVVTLNGSAAPLANITAQGALAAHLDDLAQRQGGFHGVGARELTATGDILDLEGDLGVGPKPGLEGPRLGRANIVGIHCQFGIVTEHPGEGLG